MNYTSYIDSLPIPDCALQINGKFLERNVPGYRTNSVDGRQQWGVDLTEITTDLRNGSIYRRKKDQSREFTVKFNITTDSRLTFNSSWNRLRWFLSTESSKFIFNDEPNLYMIGNVTNLSEEAITADGINAYSMSGSYTVHLSDPYKYSVDEVKVPMTTQGDQHVFNANNAGLFPSKPRFEITCGSDLGGIFIVSPHGPTLLVGDTSLPIGDAAIKFHKGDKLVIDTVGTNITLNGIPVPAYGDIANSWEEFEILNGANLILCNYTSAASISANMFYREVYR